MAWMKARNACRRLARNRASASVAALALVMALAWALHRGAVGAGYRSLRLFAMANGMEASSRGDEMLLSLPDGRKCVFKAGGTEASILGTRAYLLFPARRRLGIWGISRADAETMLAPIFRPDSLEPRPLRNIVVDAGHGGKDQRLLPDSGRRSRLHHHGELKSAGRELPARRRRLLVRRRHFRGEHSRNRT